MQHSRSDRKLAYSIYFAYTYMYTYLERGIYMGIGKIEIIVLIVLVIIVLFVGGKKLPELARGVGEAARELKKGFRDEDNKESKKKSEEQDEKTTK